MKTITLNTFHAYEWATGPNSLISEWLKKIKLHDYKRGMPKAEIYFMYGILVSQELLSDISYMPYSLLLLDSIYRCLILSIIVLWWMNSLWIILHAFRPLASQKIWILTQAQTCFQAQIKSNVYHTYLYSTCYYKYNVCVFLPTFSKYPFCAI